MMGCEVTDFTLPAISLEPGRNLSSTRITPSLVTRTATFPPVTWPS